MIYRSDLETIGAGSYKVRRVYCREKDEIYPSVAAASRVTGVAQNTIKRHIDRPDMASKAKYSFTEVTPEMMDAADRMAGEKKRPPRPKGDTICWDCVNACAGCLWSLYGEPVPGWEAIETALYGGTMRSYNVRRCPEFVEDPRL